MSVEGGELCDVKLCGAAHSVAGMTAFCDLDSDHEGAHEGYAWSRYVWTKNEDG